MSAETTGLPGVHCLHAEHCPSEASRNVLAIDMRTQWLGRVTWMLSVIPGRPGKCPELERAARHFLCAPRESRAPDTKRGEPCPSPGWRPSAGWTQPVHTTGLQQDPDCPSLMCKGVLRPPSRMTQIRQRASAWRFQTGQGRSPGRSVGSRFGREQSRVAGDKPTHVGRN